MGEGPDAIYLGPDMKTMGVRLSAYKIACVCPRYNKVVGGAAS